MKNLLLALIVVFSVSCTTFSDIKSGEISTKNGTVIKFNNAKVVKIEKDIYILEAECQYFVQEKNIKSITFNK
jgi:hypothetical protein